MQEKSKDTELRMAAIFRADLNLLAGKIGVQAGHAFLSSWIACTDREAANYYMANSQPKFCLMAPNLEWLFKIQARAKQRGVAHAMITDAGRTVFNGVPTITVLGIGPCDRTSYNNLTRDLTLMD